MMPVPYHGCTCHLRYAAAKEHAAAVASNRKQVNFRRSSVFFNLCFVYICLSVWGGDSLILISYSCTKCDEKGLNKAQKEY
jgi:hypothetical protein